MGLYKNTERVYKRYLGFCSHSLLDLCVATERGQFYATVFLTDRGRSSGKCLALSMDTRAFNTITFCIVRISYLAKSPIHAQELFEESLVRTPEKHSS